MLEPVGTAPGLVVPPAEGRDGPVVLVLPGPPPELRGMWAAALAADRSAARWPGGSELRQETVRLWRTLEAQLAVTLREVEPELDGLEITTCMREGELEIVTRFAPDAQPAYDRLLAALTDRHGDALFSTGPTLDDLVGAALADGHTVATAESCTGGLLAARLTARPGSSAYVLGRHHRLRELGQGAARRRPGRAARRARGGQRPRWPWPSPRAPAHGSAPTIGVGITGVAGPGRRDAGQAGRHGARLRRRARRRGGAGAAAAAAPGRRCGNDPSRWRCTCCATCSSAAPGLSR